MNATPPAARLAQWIMARGLEVRQTLRDRGASPLTPDELTWSKDEIAAYLNDGFTQSFDSAGGHMVDVIRNMAMLQPDDRAAIAQYLKELP